MEHIQKRGLRLVMDLESMLCMQRVAQCSGDVYLRKKGLKAGIIAILKYPKGCHIAAELRILPLYGGRTKTCG